MAKKAKAKNVNGAGSITFRKKDKIYQGSLTVGYDPDTGKPKRKYFYGKSYEDVEIKLTEAKDQRNKGVFIDAKKITLGKWLDTWLDDYVKSHVSPSTTVSYECAIRLHIKPTLGDVQLKNLRSHQAQHLYNEKTESGLSPGTIGVIHKVLRASLAQAVENDLIAKNIAMATKRAKIRNTEKEVLTSEEMRHFLEVTKKDKFHLTYLLTMTTGLRLGEVLGLRWQDVSLDEKVLRVRQILLRAKSQEGKKKTRLIFSQPKSESSVRTIPLTADVVNELRMLKVQQEGLKKWFVREGYKDKDLVFCMDNGNPVDFANFTKRFNALIKEAGVTKITFHGLRHTYATRQLEAGTSARTVQEILGHANIALTLGTYSHITEETKRTATDKIDEILKISN